MAITAPRYNPSGVHVGSMPTPMVKADTSTASALQTVGDTIASLGKSAQYVQEMQAKRAAIQKDADETAGEDAFHKLKQDVTAKYNEFSVNAVGDKTAGELKKFRDYSKAIDLTTYGGELSVGAQAALKKRADFYMRDTEIAADTVAHARLMNFQDKTGRVEIADAVGAAAMAQAGGNKADALFQVGRAVAASTRVFAASGENLGDRIIPEVNWQTLQIFNKEDYTKAASFYTERKGSFGAYEAAANKQAQKALDTVWVDEQMKAIGPKATKNGVFSVEDAMAAVAGIDIVEYHPFDKSLDKSKLAADRKAMLTERIQKFGSADLARRNEQSDQTIAALRLTQMRPGYDPSTFELIPGVSENLKQMPQDKRAVYEESKMRGPMHSNPEHVSKIRAMRWSDQDGWASIQRNQYVLSEKDWQDYVNDRDTTPKPRDREIERILKDRYTEGERQAPLPRATDGKPLGDKDKFKVDEYDARVRFVKAYVESQSAAIGKDPNRLAEFVARGDVLAQTPVQISNGKGEQITVPQASADIYPLGFVPTDAQMRKAGVSSPMDPGARQKLISVKAQEDAEAAQSATDADVESRLRAAGRPVTDAEMQAHKRRIGADAKRGWPMERGYPEMAAPKRPFGELEMRVTPTVPFNWDAYRAGPTRTL
jgi:hypothetical protein